MLHLNGTFILTVTRVSKEGTKEKEKYKKVHIKRKSNSLDKSLAIYSFLNFDDFCEFCSYLQSSPLLSICQKIKKVTLYSYQSKYFLVFHNFSADIKLLKSFCSTITEFGNFVNHSELFERKLQEYGEVVIKSNAINTCLKHFC